MFGKLKRSKTARSVITCIVALVGGAIIGLMRPPIVSSFLTARDSPSDMMRKSSYILQKRELHNTKSFVSAVQSDVKETYSLGSAGKNIPLDMHNANSVDSALQSNMKENIDSDNTEKTLPFIIIDNTESVVGVAQSNDDIGDTKNNLPLDKAYDTKTVDSESQSDMKGNFSFGFTEKNLPLVKIHDYIPVRESDEDKERRFDRIKDWLSGIPEPKPDVIRKCSSSTKKILWFDVWNRGSGVRNKCRVVDFSRCECRCEVDFFTFNESDTQKLYEPFGGDAIMFQINKMETLGHPPLKREGQVFVAVEREATAKVRIPLQNWEYVFNWTMSFRQDSDIFYPYGRIKQRTGPPPMKNYTTIYKRKKKAIIWFVSHCKTRSKREDFARELSKYIDLDIVGGCGRDICPRDSIRCLKKFEEEYFFRFNFENTYHTDYVTEKLFENFSTDMIQIVGGGAEYDDIVPIKTVIDLNDFETPQDLATYLKLLMSKEDLYTEYLRTKDNYYADILENASQSAYCELCSMLHDPDRYKNLYFSVGDWFHDHRNMRKTTYPRGTSELFPNLFSD